MRNTQMVKKISKDVRHKSIQNQILKRRVQRPHSSCANGLKEKLNSLYNEEGGGERKGKVPQN